MPRSSCGATLFDGQALILENSHQLSPGRDDPLCRQVWRDEVGNPGEAPSAEDICATWYCGVMGALAGTIRVGPQSGSRDLCQPAEM